MSVFDYDDEHIHNYPIGHQPYNLFFTSIKTSTIDSVRDESA